MPGSAVAVALAGAAMAATPSGPMSNLVWVMRAPETGFPSGMWVKRTLIAVALPDATGGPTSSKRYSWAPAIACCENDSGVSVTLATATTRLQRATLIEMIDMYLLNH